MSFMVDFFSFESAIILPVHHRHNQYFRSEIFTCTARARRSERMKKQVIRNDTLEMLNSFLLGKSVRFCIIHLPSFSWCSSIRLIVVIHPILLTKRTNVQMYKWANNHCYRSRDQNAHRIFMQKHVIVCQKAKNLQTKNEHNKLPDSMEERRSGQKREKKRQRERETHTKIACFMLTAETKTKLKQTKSNKCVVVVHKYRTICDFFLSISSYFVIFLPLFCEFSFLFVCCLTCPLVRSLACLLIPQYL